MKLRVDRGVASEHTISLGERSRFHNFEHLNSIYTDGDEITKEIWAVASKPVESGGGTSELVVQIRKLIACKSKTHCL